MVNSLLTPRGFLLAFALLTLTACPKSEKKCTTDADCESGQRCDVATGICSVNTDTDAGEEEDAGIDAGPIVVVNNGADTCEEAPLITTNLIIKGDTTGKQDDYNPTCTGSDSLGPDSVYKIKVPPGQRLKVIATPEVATTGHQYDLALYLIDTPASNCSAPDSGMSIGCLAVADDAAFFASPETVSYINYATADIEVFIVVDSAFLLPQNNPDGGVGVTGAGRFTLTTSIQPFLPGENCSNAVALTPGVTIQNQELTDFNNDYNDSAVSCFGSSSPDVAYTVTVPAGQSLELTVTPSATLDTTLSISETVDTCGLSCIDVADSPVAGEPEVYRYKNTTSNPKTLFVVVDGFAGGLGHFDILAELIIPEPDDVCSAPTQLTPGIALTAQSVDQYSNDYSSGDAPAPCQFKVGPDRVYSLTVPNGERATITVTADLAETPVINVVTDVSQCGNACVASQDGNPSTPAEMTFTNTTGSTHTYLLIVDFWGPTSKTFEIVANVAPPPLDETCAGPTLLSDGVPLTAQSTRGYTNDYEANIDDWGCTKGNYDGDRVYEISIPPNLRGTVTVTPAADSAFNPNINLVEGMADACAAIPRTCAVGSNTADVNAAESVPVFNTDTLPKRYFVLVDGTSNAWPPGGPFDISFTTSTPTADDTCTTNVSSLDPDAGVIQDTLTGFAPDYVSGINCAPSQGPDRVYKIAVAPLDKFVATVTPTDFDGGFDPVINFIPTPASTCEVTPRVCRTGRDAQARNIAEVAAFTNNTNTVTEMYLVVSDYLGQAANRDYALTSTAGPAPAGESCASPLVAIPGLRKDQTTAEASADLQFVRKPVGCVPTGNSPDVVYSIVVPINQTLTVTALPAASEDLVINLVEGPADNCNNVTQCLASADEAFANMPEAVTYINTSPAAKTVFIQITGKSPVTTFSLHVKLE